MRTDRPKSRQWWLAAACGAAALLALQTGGCFVPSPDFPGKACNGEHPCRPGHSCCDGVCVPGAECPGCPGETTRQFCDRLGVQCGPLSGVDACDAGRAVDCGGCTPPATCSGGGAPGICGTPSCTSETNQAFCARFDAGCGDVEAKDNCDVERKVDCGGCVSPATCGGGGQPGRCGCTPDTDAELCARLGVGCGTASGNDRCGTFRSVSCPSCTLPQTCGGGGDAGQCGCVPLGGSGCRDAGMSCCEGGCFGTVNNGRCCLGLGEPCLGTVPGECCQGMCSPTTFTCCRQVGVCTNETNFCCGACDTSSNQCWDP